MKAAVLYKDQTHLRIEDVPIPELKPGDVRVNIKCCGVCGSDIHMTIHKQVRLRHYPTILGHEASGVVTEVGSDVKKFKKGDRVVVCSGLGCGKCRQCLKGRHNLCPEINVLGAEMNGAYAEQITIEERHLYHLPDQIPFDQGAILADAVSTPYHALKFVGKIEPGEVVAVYGCGGLGIHAVTLARALGASKVIALDVDEGALDNAGKYKADEMIDLRRVRNSGKTLQELTGGVDLMLDFSGHYSNFEDAMRAMNPGGRMVMAGIGKHPFKLTFPFMVINKQISVLGSLGCDSRAIPELIDLYTSGRLDLSTSITSHHPLEDVNQCLENLYYRKGNPIRFIITPNGKIGAQ
ncbi:MAG TPA: zinc-binding dehydrogenase [Leptospiraceae bacterium]|jgi:propanol-preferring alcohol dehydrogenase|nr:zinc-binding dehydrogenase [Leptospirales bacterium]HMU84805.1 zinc-binding dehydrogenase [Leptospiraceae bacterium]HMX55553.1 zinc-binding dehydrogenase [Leptospiraceae bacterium]HMZ38371.1 zinc-binding dehydrogenase [Leptospiraceae bacterium]HNJ32655.1 zinc-binding dehydrogenase [Leptospiraceae bacterium]